MKPIQWLSLSHVAGVLKIHDEHLSGLKKWKEFFTREDIVPAFAKFLADRSAFPGAPSVTAATYETMLRDDRDGKYSGSRDVFDPWTGWWLGDWGGAYGCEPGILERCEAALTVYEGMGAIIAPLAPPFPAEKLWQCWTTLRAMLNAGAMRDLYDNPAKRALLKPETIWEIERGQGLTAAQVYEASTTRSRWYAHAARLFQRYDALAMPATQVWPFPAEWRWPQSINGQAMDTYHRWMEVVVPVSLAGLPSLCLPAGFGAGGLPTGVQLFGPTGADAKILGMGQAYHLATDWPRQRPPRL